MPAEGLVQESEDDIAWKPPPTCLLGKDMVCPGLVLIQVQPDHQGFQEVEMQLVSPVAEESMHRGCALAW